MHHNTEWLTRVCLRGIIPRGADVAQLVEQLSCKQQVTSSSLVVGSSPHPPCSGGMSFYLLQRDAPPGFGRFNRPKHHRQTVDVVAAITHGRMPRALTVDEVFE